MAKVRDILAYMQRVGTWVNWEQTVDRVIVGSPDADVKNAAVAWIASRDALQKAERLGCQLLITHEPTFYSHTKELDHLGEWPGAAEKKEFIEKSGLAVLRCHDTWDNMPEVGIPWSWAAFLNIKGKPSATRPYLNVWPVGKRTLGELAQRVAERTAGIGEPAVQVVGDLAMPVTHLGVGTGCACWPIAYREMGAQAGILCDDGSSYWRDIQWAADNGFGVIRVNHGTSEEPGVAAMAKHFSEKFAEVRFHHIPQGARFRLVSAK